MSEQRSGLMGFRLDSIGAAIVLLFALLILPLRLLTSQVYINTLPFVLGGAAGLYLLARRYQRGPSLGRLPRWAAQLLPSVTVLLLAGMLVLGSLRGRTHVFHYLTLWAGVLVFVQVFFVADEDLHPGALLGQVVALALVVRLTAVLATPGYIGIDVWTHVPNWTAAIREANSLQPIASEKYYASPLFHLLVAVASMVLDVSLRHALVLTVGLVTPLAALFIYATARLFVDPRWAVFATAAYSVSGDVVEWGVHLIPTSLGLVFFLAVFYSLTRLLYLEYNVRDLVVVVLFSIAIILTHQISAFIMFVFIGASLLARLLFSIGLFEPGSPFDAMAGRRETANLLGLLVFDLGVITFVWSLTPYKGSNFLETILSWFVSSVTTSAQFLNLASSSAPGSSEAAAPSRALVEAAVSYVDVAGILLALFAAVIGSLYVFRRENSSHAAVTSVVAIVFMLVFIFGFPLFGIRQFVPGRWMAFLVAPLAVIGAIGLGYLTARAPARVVVAVLLLFTLALPAVSVTSTEGALESPVFDDTQLRYGYTEQELAAVRTVDDVTRPGDGEYLYTDHPYYTVFKRSQDYPARVAHLEEGEMTNGTVLYREYHGSGAAYFETQRERPVQRALDVQAVCGGRSVGYDNGDARLCLRAA